MTNTTLSVALVLLVPAFTTGERPALAGLLRGLQAVLLAVMQGAFAVHGNCRSPSDNGSSAAR